MTAVLLSALVSLQPLVSEDVLEPSVQNEVDHAISMAPAEAWTAATNETTSVVAPQPAAPRCACRCADCSGNRPPAPVVPADPFGTNGLSTTSIALKLISSQGPDGRWRIGTNDVTVAALRLLLSL